MPVLIISFGVQPFNLTSFFADGHRKMYIGMCKNTSYSSRTFVNHEWAVKESFAILKKSLAKYFWQNTEMIVWLISSFHHMKNPLSKKEFKTYVTIWHGRIIEEVLF